MTTYYCTASGLLFWSPALTVWIFSHETFQGFPCPASKLCLLSFCLGAFPAPLPVSETSLPFRVCPSLALVNVSSLTFLCCPLLQDLRAQNRVLEDFITALEPRWTEFVSLELCGVLSVRPSLNPPEFSHKPCLSCAILWMNKIKSFYKILNTHN